MTAPRADLGNCLQPGGQTKESQRRPGMHSHCNAGQRLAGSRSKLQRNQSKDLRGVWSCPIRRHARAAEAQALLANRSGKKAIFEITCAACIRKLQCRLACCSALRRSGRRRQRAATPTRPEFLLQPRPLETRESRPAQHRRLCRHPAGQHQWPEYGPLIPVAQTHLARYFPLQVAFRRLWPPPLAGRPKRWVTPAPLRQHWRLRRSPVQRLAQGCRHQIRLPWPLPHRVWQHRPALAAARCRLLAQGAPPSLQVLPCLHKEENVS